MAQRKRKTGANAGRVPAADAARASGPRAPRTSKARPERKRLVVGALLSLALIGTGAWLVLGGTSGPREGLPSALVAGAAKDFNVVIVSMDTTRADHIGCYGYHDARTPNLDGLAAEGLRFEHAISPVPLTLPSHATMLTGLDPPAHGARHNGEYRLDPSHTTLAERLKAAGYETAAFVSSFVLDARFGLAQGVDVYDDTVEPKPGDAFGGHDSERKAEAVTNAAVQWLQSRDSSRPYFLWVHYYDPHADYEPPRPYASLFPTRPYDGEIAYMDDQIGRLMSVVAGRGGRERTLTILVGDHGESLDEHEESTHGRGIYDSTQRVPLVVWSPGLFARGHVVRDAVVGVVDVFPTVLDLLGMEPQERLDGISLLSAGRDPDRMVYMETLCTYLDSGWAPLYGLRRLQDKYIHAPKPEYYDLQSDPRERNNLYAQATPQQLEALGALATKLAERVKGSPSAEEVAASAVAMDPESIERLRSLGYFAGRDEERPAAGQALPNPRDAMGTWSMVQEAKRLCDKQRFAECLSRAQRAYARAPEDRMVLHTVGIALMYLDRLDEATSFLLRYIELRPNANVYVSLAQIAVKQGRPIEAEGYIEKALALEPEHGGAIMARGDLLAIQGRFDEALQAYDQAEQIDPHRTKPTLASRRTKVKSFQEGNR